MNDLISRKDALSLLTVYTEKDALGSTPAEIIKHMPSVDPVVRCKDCKYAYMTDDGYCNWCDIMADLLGLEYDDIHLPGDWFCADGKKVTE